MGQPDAEHPTQGRPFDGRLELQPPSQLLTLLSILRSFSSTDSCAGVNGVVGDLGRDATLCATRVGRCGGFAARCGLCGLAIRLGAWTVMPGSDWVVAAAMVCDIAVPLGPHNNAVE